MGRTESNNQGVGGDITQYISNAGEPLTEENYNEIDALVFAELSYMKYENVYLDGSFSRNTSVSVDQFAYEVYNSNVEENADKAAFLRALADSDRYKNCQIINMAAENESSQWGALTIEIGDGSDTSVVAMRGTNATTLGWEEDFQLAYDIDGTEAQQLSAEYLGNCTSSNIFLTGHSKGGNDIISAYVMNDEGVRARVSRLYNYDGPGVNAEFQERYSEGYSELNDKLHNYYPENSIIGLLLIDNPGEVTYFDTDTSGHTEIPILGEHDPFSFKVDVNQTGCFQSSEQSILSQYANSVIDDAMRKLSNEERDRAMQVLFKIGVPAMIAGQDEGNPFANDKNIFSVVGTGIEIWKSCTWEERIAAGELMIGVFSSVIPCGIELAIDKVEELVQTTKKTVQDSFQKLADNVSSFGNWMYNGIKDISKSVASKVSSYYSGIAGFISEFISRRNRKTQNGQNMSRSGRGVFTINISAVREVKNEFPRAAGKIRQYCEELNGIQSVLIRFGQWGNLTSIKVVQASLMDLAVSCNQCGDVLANAIEIYAGTENGIRNEVGL